MVESESISLYDHFLVRLEKITLTKPTPAKELQKAFGELCKMQLDRWLKQAVDEGRVVRNVKPVRYQWQSQAALFGRVHATGKPRRRKP